VLKSLLIMISLLSKTQDWKIKNKSMIWNFELASRLILDRIRYA
jgi:hypothetical protein